MRRIFYLSIAVLSFSSISQAQTLSLAATEADGALQSLPPETIKFAPAADVPEVDVYHMNWAVDIPVTAVGAGWSAYAFSKIYSKDPSPIEDIENLDKNDINSFDRPAAGLHDENASATSDYLFYGSMPLPFLLLADKKVRHHAGKVGFLYLESMAITGLLYTGSTYFVDRYRPETYNTDKPASERVNGNYRNAFFAGHVALVATASFFTAKIYNDYHPDSKWRWVLFGGAIAATGTTAYLRYAAGKHFPSDILIGTAVGTLSGLLVPQLHKNKPIEDRAWILSPSFGNGYGLSFVYRIR